MVKIRMSFALFGAQEWTDSLEMYGKDKHGSLSPFIMKTLKKDDRLHVSMILLWGKRRGFSS